MVVNRSGLLVLEGWSHFNLQVVVRRSGSPVKVGEHL